MRREFWQGPDLSELCWLPQSLEISGWPWDRSQPSLAGSEHCTSVLNVLPSLFVWLVFGGSVSLCRPGWPQTQSSACLCLPGGMRTTIFLNPPISMQVAETLSRTFLLVCSPRLTFLSGLGVGGKLLILTSPQMSLGACLME